jgi:hypothetical protein
LVDDTPIVPGDAHPAFAEGEAARQVLNDAEDDLRHYQLEIEPIHSNAGNLSMGAMPGTAATSATTTGAVTSEPTTNEGTVRSASPVGVQYDKAGSAPYPLEEAERIDAQQETARQEVANVA